MVSWQITVHWSTSGSCRRSWRKDARRCFANGKRISRTKATEMRVPSMSMRTYRTMRRLPAIPLIDSGIRIVRDPAGLVGEDTNRAHLWGGAQVEPVLCVGRDRNEIALLAQQSEDFILAPFLVKPKKALAFNKDTHFILAVSVLPDEFFTNPFQIRRVSIHTDHIRRLVAALFHEGLEQVVVSGEDVFVRGSGR